MTPFPFLGHCFLESPHGYCFGVLVFDLGLTLIMDTAFVNKPFFPKRVLQASEFCLSLTKTLMSLCTGQLRDLLQNMQKSYFLGVVKGSKAAI